MGRNTKRVDKSMEREMADCERNDRQRRRTMCRPKEDPRYLNQSCDSIIDSTVLSQAYDPYRRCPPAAAWFYTCASYDTQEGTWVLMLGRSSLRRGEGHASSPPPHKSRLTRLTLFLSRPSLGTCPSPIRSLPLPCPQSSLSFAGCPLIPSRSGQKARTSGPFSLDLPLSSSPQFGQRSIREVLIILRPLTRPARLPPAEPLPSSAFSDVRPPSTPPCSQWPLPRDVQGLTTPAPPRAFIGQCTSGHSKMRPKWRTCHS